MWSQVQWGGNRIMADFFNKVKEGLDKGVSTISVKSQELVETSKIKTEINNLKQKHSQAIGELGNLVYVMMGSTGLDVEKIRNKYEQIILIEEQIKDKEKELQLTYQRSQEILGKSSPSTGLVCQCGTPYKAGAKFCGKCGNKLD